MLRTRTFQETLNIKKPCQFVANKYDNVLSRLKTVYEKRCFRGTYIYKILEINRMSKCEIIASDLESSGIIHVEFIANILNVATGDVIAKTKVNISNDIIYTESEYSLCTLEKSHNNKVLINGQYIPIMVDYVGNYNTNTRLVNVFAKILLPLTTSPIYELVAPLESKQYSSLRPLIEQIESFDERSLIKAEKFSKLLSGYKTFSDNKRNVVDIVQIVKKSSTEIVEVEGYWQKNLKQISISSNYMREKKKPEDGKYVTVKTGQAFADMLVLVIQMRRAAVQLSEIYDTPEMYNQAESLWSLMRENQL